jgi:hypothetical protein
MDIFVSATDNPVKVFEKLAKESLKKRIAGPFKYIIFLQKNTL